MSPEYLNNLNQIDKINLEKSDIFSLGLIILRLNKCYNKMKYKD